MHAPLQLIVHILESLSLKQERKNGMTNHEICVKLNVKERRRVSEQIMAMKDQGIVRQELCRCGQAPIYYFYK